MGRVPYDVWIIPPIRNVSKEGTGFPTQKPLALYERIIKASSNESDIVLDPFCGCATTCVAAERLGRQWVGIDIWKDAHRVVLERLEQEGLFYQGKSNTGRLVFKGRDVFYETKLPERTDDKMDVIPHLRVKKVIKEPAGPRWTRAKCLEYLLEQQGPVCQGCNRKFDDPRYLQVDHITPRADGGMHHIRNRILLCGPCNNLKSNTLTLSGLINKNKELGYMVS